LAAIGDPFNQTQEAPLKITQAWFFIVGPDLRNDERATTEGGADDPLPEVGAAFALEGGHGYLDGGCGGLLVEEVVGR
jgi:hypothetical protein